MSRLIICRGIPASGKTTWARAWVEAGPNRARVNRDEIRKSIFVQYAGLSHGQENCVTKVQYDSISRLLKAGYDVVVDDTNLRASTVTALATLAGEGDVVERQDFPIPVDEAIKRDALRDRSVGEAVVRSFYNRYIRNGVDLPPWPVGGFTEVTRQYVQDPTLTQAVIVDIDGTIAKMNGRGPYEWHRVGEDLPKDDVIDIVAGLTRGGIRAVLVSGRDASCRQETEEWLGRNLVPYDRLFMRPAGDNRKDSIVKQEIFWEDIAPNYCIFGVFDDRNQVVEMWRSLGLTCMQVALGDF